MDNIILKFKILREQFDGIEHDLVEIITSRYVMDVNDFKSMDITNTYEEKLNFFIDRFVKAIKRYMSDMPEREFEECLDLLIGNNESI